MLIGEKPPAWAPCTTNMPIISGLILYRPAKPSAIGPMMAQAAGLAAPIAVSTAVTPNITHGISTTRPPTARTADLTMTSTVPLFLAIANRYVTPTRVRTRSPLMPAMISFSSRFREYMPTSQAATKASAPMLIGSTVPTTNSAMSARMDTHSGDMTFPWAGAWGEARDGWIA